MPVKTSARCALQVARARRLSGYPDDFGLEQDICDVALWVQEKFRLSAVNVWVDRHRQHTGQDISGVFIVATLWHPGPISLSAQETFIALGYTIEDTGEEIIAHPLCDGNHSRHEAMQAYRRIESALRNWRSP